MTTEDTATPAPRTRAELEVIYDPALEMAAIINLDTRQGWGPSMVGPSAKQILEAFLSGTPFDLTAVDSATATNFFEDWFSAVSEQADQAAPEGQAVSVEPDGAAAVADSTAATTAEGAPTDEPPNPAPSDTDMGADTSTTDQVTAPAVADPAAQAQAAADQTAAEQSAPGATQTIPCPACEGRGDANCPLCKGVGKIAV